MKNIKLVKSLVLEAKGEQVRFIKDKYYIACYYQDTRNLYLFRSGIEPSGASQKEILNIIDFITSLYDNVHTEIF